MTVAFSDDKVGHAEAPRPVRAPVVADLSRPRFLAPGDTAELTLELHNLAGEPGEYRIVVTADGAAAIRDGAEQTLPPERDGQAERRIGIEAHDPGAPPVSLSLPTPGGLAPTPPVP